MWKKTVVAYFKVLSQQMPECTEAARNLSYDSQSLGKYLNTELPEHQAGALTTQPLRPCKDLQFYKYLHSVLHIPSCSVSLVIVVKLKDKTQFFYGHQTVVLYFIREITLAKAAHVLKMYLLPYIVRRLFQDTVLRAVSTPPI
jgi:hypothetical protein